LFFPAATAETGFFCNRRGRAATRRDHDRLLNCHFSPLPFGTLTGCTFRNFWRFTRNFLSHFAHGYLKLPFHTTGFFVPQ